MSLGVSREAPRRKAWGVSLMTSRCTRHNHPSPHRAERRASACSHRDTTRAGGTIAVQLIDTAREEPDGVTDDGLADEAGRSAPAPRHPPAFASAYRPFLPRA